MNILGMLVGAAICVLLAELIEAVALIILIITRRSK